ncbi:MAG: prolipoprotein diacylglyceryl transferase [Bacteroidales bacterium]|jgi:prolipoprotein diacylglyceryl transferase|nr:prolipoprotein diacylglyceryl transferase [Bacteroidales bacterium]
MNKILYINWDVSPIIFKLGTFEVKWYSFMMFAAFAIGYLIYRKMIICEKKPIIACKTILFPTIIAMLVGARIGHCLFYEPEVYFFNTSNMWKIFIPIENGKFTGFKGLASHGAAIAIPIGLYYYSRANKISYLWVVDRVAIIIALAGFFVRIGNFMNSEIYGHETNLPWGFVFLRAGETIPKHPTQLYEALSYLLIFLFLYIFYLKRKPTYKNGRILSFFLILFFGVRFLIEFIKENQVKFEDNMLLNMGQILSIPPILVGIVWLMYLNKLNQVQQTKI